MPAYNNFHFIPPFLHNISFFPILSHFVIQSNPHSHASLLDHLLQKEFNPIFAIPIISAFLQDQFSFLVKYASTSPRIKYKLPYFSCSHVDQNTKRESGRKVQIGNIQAAKVTIFVYSANNS